MIRTLLALLALAALLLVAPARLEAAGPVNPKTAQWDAPLTNTDTSALIDLAGYNVFIATASTPPLCPSPAWTKIVTTGSSVTVLAPNPAPVPGTKGTWAITGIPGTAGQKHLTVTAVDLTGVESSCATSVPFVSKAPGVPSNIQLLP